MTDYLDLLRADLADKEFIERIRRPAGHPRVFQIEMAGLGMLVAVCTTLANRLADEAIAAGSAIGLFDIFRPKRTAHQIAGDAGLLGVPNNLEFAARLADERIEFAVRITSAWAHSERSAYADLVPAAVLADAWRNACKALTTILSVLDFQEMDAETSKASANCSATLELLIEAMHGRTPCCDEAGCLSIPGWAERRVVHRARTNLAACIVAAGDRYPGEIVNVSKHGFGVACAAEVRVGSQIEIAVFDRVLGATVRWAHNGHFGVHLDEQLEECDDLLQGALAESVAD